MIGLLPAARPSASRLRPGRSTGSGRAD